jgi:hypothetical protein
VHSRLGWQMFQNDLLDLAIGLVFVWFVLSLIISVVNDGIALLFRIRAKNLWLGIDRLLNPKDGRYARRFWDAVIFLPFSNWNRKGLDVRPKAAAGSSDSSRPQKRLATNIMSAWNSGMANSDPTTVTRRQQTQKVYNLLAPMITDVAISGRTSKLTKVSGSVFADAIGTLIRPVHPADLVGAARSLHWPQLDVVKVANALGTIPADDVVDFNKTEALLRAFGVDESAQQQLYAAAAELFTARDVLDLFKENEEVVRALQGALKSSRADEKAAAITSTVQKWFDREMEQASALYRRQNRKILAILALPVVFFFQANTLGIIADLRNDSALRDAVANQAIASIDATSLDQITAKYCPPDSGAGSDVGAADDPLEHARSKFECAGKVIASANAFALLPDLDIVKSFDGQQGLSFADVWHYEFDRWGVFGRAITILALMFGAQFWFDGLRRLVGIRKSLGGESGSVAG